METHVDAFQCPEEFHTTDVSEKKPLKGREKSGSVSVKMIDNLTSNVVIETPRRCGCRNVHIGGLSYDKVHTVDEESPWDYRPMVYEGKSTFYNRRHPKLSNLNGTKSRKSGLKALHLRFGTVTTGLRD